jgi:sigma-E factor negative regulatory protein RseB
MSASRGAYGSCSPASGLLFLLALSPLLGRAAEDPRAWLARMSDAVEYLNYEGTLVHMHGGDSSVLRITHRAENGRVTERITSEDAGREIIRTEDEVTCIFPDQRTVLIGERDDEDETQSPLRVHLPGASRIDESLYHVSFAGSERIAGRKTQVIAIRPKDSFRYGYRIWLDTVTAMPLKTQLVDERGSMLEQILFTEIELPETIPSSAVKPSMPVDSFAVKRAAPPTAARRSGDLQDWVATDIPRGFELTVPDANVTESDNALRHVVYSDGLAAVSLFIEPAVAAAEQAEGLSQIGAAMAYTTTFDGYMITAVGEVPARTVELFARSARPASGAAPSR